MTEHDVAIVGAGPAGVSVALSLRDRGLRPLLIDRADQVASSWRSRYDRLKLNTGRPFSHLPNRPYPKGTPMFPTRDDVVAHLDRHAGEDGIELRLGSEAQRIERTRRRLVRPHLDGRRRRAASGRRDRLPERPRTSRNSRETTGSPPNCCTRRNTATPTRIRAEGCWWSARGRREWSSRTTLRPAGRPRSGWQCARRRTSCCGHFLVGCPAISSRVPLYRLPVRVADAIGTGRAP